MRQYFTSHYKTHPSSSSWACHPSGPACCPVYCVLCYFPGSGPSWNSGYEPLSWTLCFARWAEPHCDLTRVKWASRGLWHVVHVTWYMSRVTRHVIHATWVRRGSDVRSFDQQNWDNRTRIEQTGGKVIEFLGKLYVKIKTRKICRVKFITNSSEQG